MPVRIHAHDPIGPAKVSGNSSCAFPQFECPIRSSADTGNILFDPDRKPRHAVTSPSRSGSPVFPPPKAGEYVTPPKYQAFGRMQPLQAELLRTCPYQMPSAPPSSCVRGPISASPTSTSNAIQLGPARRRAKSLAEGTRGGSFEYPSGYIQNPYALEMTVEQRIATDHEDESEQGLPAPNGTHSRGKSTASTSIHDSVGILWKRARRNTEGLLDNVHDYWLSGSF
ncbi:MAG: hypothetical protein Q9225_003473 [Loekoesia sp. 1 TL-2023]